VIVILLARRVENVILQLDNVNVKAVLVMLNVINVLKDIIEIKKLMVEK